MADPRGTVGAPPSSTQTSTGGIYIGVAAGSDLETLGVAGPGAGMRGSAMGARFGQQFRGYYGHRKPLYKVGYQNSKRFARELGNMDPNVVYLYQQRLNAVGMLDKFTPGKLDKATRGAFKELLTTANQNASTWQSALQDIEAVGGVVDTNAREKQKPAAFVAQLDDPKTLREAFQQTAQSLYGGDLPDNEINAMVDAYRSIQGQKQKAAYDADLAAQDGGVSSTIEAIPSAGDFAASQIREKHPDQINRVKFSDTLGTILQTLGSSPAGST